MREFFTLEVLQCVAVVVVVMVPHIFGWCLCWFQINAMNSVNESFPFIFRGRPQKLLFATK